MRNGVITEILIAGQSVRVMVNEWKIVFLDNDDLREQRLDIHSDLVNGIKNPEVGIMALIVDCDSAITEGSDGWIALETANVPMQKKMALNTHTGSAGEGTYEHPVFEIASLSVDVAGNSLIIQTVKGVDEASGQSSTTKYERISALALGHQVGTDWTSWTKVS